MWFGNEIIQNNQSFWDCAGSSVVVVFGDWVVGSGGRSDNEIWDHSADCWLGAYVLIYIYIDECQMVGSLTWLSSNSKNTLSGLTTLSLCNHAGNTYFLSKASRVFLNDLVKTIDDKSEVKRPVAADTIKNFPFHESFVCTNEFKTDTLWRAWISLTKYPIREDGGSIHSDTGPGLISLCESFNLWVVVAGEVVSMSEGGDSISFFVSSFEFNHFWTINYFI